MSDLPQPYDDVFLDLQDIGLDPYVEKTHRQAKALDDLLNAARDTTDNELALLMVDDKRIEALEIMNSECPYLHKAVYVTGKLLQPYWDELEKEFKYEEKVYQREPLIASGYAALQMDMNDTNRWVTGHVFYIGDTEPKVGSLSRQLHFTDSLQLVKSI